MSCGEISHQNTRLFLYCSGVPFFRLRTFYSHYNFDMIIMTLLRWPCSPFTSILLAANFSFTLFIHKYGIPRASYTTNRVCENEAERRKKNHVMFVFSLFFCFNRARPSIEVHGSRTFQREHDSHQRATDQPGQ